MEALPDLEEWLQDSNDAINITLLSPSRSGSKNIATFHPKFTYNIFEDEKIFGYKDLKVNLRYRANDMRPHLRITHGKKFNGVGETQATDVVEVLREGQYLPQIAYAKSVDFDESSKQLGDNWTPPGKLHSSIAASDGEYEIWVGNLADPAVQQLNTRVQFLIPLFIEGGTYVGQDPETGEFDFSDADRWTVFFLYRKQPSEDDAEKSSYVFVGYATVYRFFYFRPPSPPTSPGGDWELPKGDTEFSELPCRTRLSQFLILPPFQGKGNGARLYDVIFKHYHADPLTHEFTVENPNEAFDDLRDACDLGFLRTMPEFQALKLDANLSIPKSGPLPKLVSGSANLENIRLKAKIASRQFSRVLEMHLMSSLPDSVRPSITLDDDVPAPTKEDKHLEKIWQLMVKQRLYRHNKDVLSQIELNERIDKLTETLGGVELEYARLLAAHERSVRHANATNFLVAEDTAHGKRKSVEPHEHASSSKRARVDDE